MTTEEACFCNNILNRIYTKIVSSSIRMHHFQTTAMITMFALIPVLSVVSLSLFASDVSATLYPGSNYCVVNNCTPEECAAVYPNDDAGYRTCTGQIGIPNVPQNYFFCAQSGLTKILSPATLLGIAIMLTTLHANNVFASSNGNCDPSYPDVCIAPPPPNLNCNDVPYNDIKVAGDDPHGFDREGDGDRV